MVADDAAFLLDMLDGARMANKYAARTDLESFYRDRLIQDGVIRQIQIIGEAASHVSVEFREAHPEIPWDDIIGMRHRLVHDYRNIDLDLAWQAATREAVFLTKALEPLVPPDT
jgi:uncharacterized protein with HEPN domain